MGAFTRMPIEILYEIVSYLDGDFQSLAICSRISRSFWKPAVSVLYSNIDLTLDYRLLSYGAPKAAKDKSLARQKRLILSLAENRDLGGLILSFQNGESDVTPDLPPDVLESAARNMRSLCWAKLTRNGLAARTISSLQLYPHLVDLSIEGLSPFKFIWDLKPTSLRKLTWEFTAPDDLDPIPYVASIVKHTCLFLTSLDIIINHSCWTDFLEGPAIEIPKERIQYYQKMKTDHLVLGNLQHLGIRYEDRLERNPKVHDSVRKLAWQHHHSLTSLCIVLDMLDSLGHATWKTDILDMSDKLKNLKELTLLGEYSRSKDIIETVTASFNKRLERFSLLDIGSPFNAKQGRSFGTWTRLKYLWLGDCEMEDGPYDNDGRPDFSNYNLMEFIRYLPAQLEELHLWIHGEGLVLEHNGDFDPVCELAVPIFRSLRRLHTCDILAFICDGHGRMPIGRPENAVHYRRLRHGSPASSISLPSNKIKDIWVSRMGCEYGKHYPRVGHRCETIELGDGDGYFEGRDAKDIWMGGTMGGKWNPQEQVVHKQMRGHFSHESPDMTWPGYNGTRFFKYPKYIEANDGYGRI